MPEEAVTENAVEGEKPAGGEAGEGGLESATPEELIAEIKKLRTENAAKRVRTREAAAELKAFEEWKRSQMSEADQLRADLDAARAEATSAYVDVFADRYGVPESRRKFISGSNKEEIEEACKALGESKPADGGQAAGGVPTSAPPIFPGVRGAAVGSKKPAGASADDLLRTLLRK